MKEKPILFSTPMVRAILDGRKTQTRRVVKPLWFPVIEASNRANGYPALSVFEGEIICPYGQPGDRLYVKETFFVIAETPEQMIGPIEKCRIVYRADGFDLSEYLMPDKNDPNKTRPATWNPSLYMPKSAARIWLEITGVRVERVQDISAEDAFDEGCNYRNSDGELCHDGGHPSYSILSFRGLWDSINGKRPGYAWQDNPWVWVIEFKRINKE